MITKSLFYLCICLVLSCNVNKNNRCQLNRISFKKKIIEDDFNSYKLTTELIINEEKLVLQELICKDTIGYGHQKIDLLNYVLNHNVEIDSVLGSIPFKKGDTVFVSHNLGDDSNTLLIQPKDSTYLFNSFLNENKIRIESHEKLIKPLLYCVNNYLSECPEYCPGEGGNVIVYSIFFRKGEYLYYRCYWYCSGIRALLYFE